MVVVLAGRSAEYSCLVVVLNEEEKEKERFFSFSFFFCYLVVGEERGERLRDEFGVQLLGCGKREEERERDRD